MNLRTTVSHLIGTTIGITFGTMIIDACTRHHRTPGVFLACVMMSVCIIINNLWTPKH